MNPLLLLPLLLLGLFSPLVWAEDGEAEAVAAEKKACEAAIKEDDARDEQKLTDAYRAKCKALTVASVPLKPIETAATGGTTKQTQPDEAAPATSGSGGGGTVDQATTPPAAPTGGETRLGAFAPDESYPDEGARGRGGAENAMAFRQGYLDEGKRDLKDTRIDNEHYLAGASAQRNEARVAQAQADANYPDETQKGMGATGSGAAYREGYLANKAGDLDGARAEADANYRAGSEGHKQDVQTAIAQNPNPVITDSGEVVKKDDAAEAPKVEPAALKDDTQKLPAMTRSDLPAPSTENRRLAQCTLKATQCGTLGVLRDAYNRAQDPNSRVAQILARRGQTLDQGAYRMAVMKSGLESSYGLARSSVTHTGRVDVGSFNHFSPGEIDRINRTYGTNFTQASVLNNLNDQADLSLIQTHDLLTGADRKQAASGRSYAELGISREQLAYSMNTMGPYRNLETYVNRWANPPGDHRGAFVYNWNRNIGYHSNVAANVDGMNLGAYSNNSYTPSYNLPTSRVGAYNPVANLYGSSYSLGAYEQQQVWGPSYAQAPVYGPNYQANTAPSMPVIMGGTPEAATTGGVTGPSGLPVIKAATEPHKPQEGELERGFERLREQQQTQTVNPNLIQDPSNNGTPVPANLGEGRGYDALSKGTNI